MLVVDDNPDDLVLFERAVKRQGWVVATAESGRAGLERLRKERFDVVVLDYNLGDMTGTEVLLRLKEAGVTTPVLIQSGLGSEFIVARALALGAEGFLAKDSRTYAEDIQGKVAAALERALPRAGREVREARREEVEEVEGALDDLLERGRGQLVAVGFASPDGFRVSTRFRGAQALTPETICAMVASATSTCTFLGEGLDLSQLRLVSADFAGGRFYACPVPAFGVLFAATAEAGDTGIGVRAELEFAARELATLLSTLRQTQQYTY